MSKNHDGNRERLRQVESIDEPSYISPYHKRAFPSIPLWDGFRHFVTFETWGEKNYGTTGKHDTRPKDTHHLLPCASGNSRL